MNTGNQKMNKKNIKQCWAIGVFTALIFMASCTKDTMPSEGSKNTAINFFIASDVMNTAYSSSFGVTAAYIDTIADTASRLIYNSNSLYPQFAFGYVNANVEYPLTNQHSGINLFTYTYYNAGSHRVIFTDVTNTTVKDTTLQLADGTYNTLYLTDLPAAAGAKPSYTLVQITEPRKAQADLTGIRFINLSPDASKLEVQPLTATGKTKDKALTNVAFGKASDYAYLTQDEVVNGVLRFKISNSSTSTICAVPVKPGRCFVVVVRGFVNSTTRQIAKGKDAKGNIDTQTVPIAANLRTEVRASY